MEKKDFTQMKELAFSKLNVSPEEYEMFKDYTLINFMPANRKIILKPYVIETKSKGGIILTAEANEDTFVAMVVSMARDCRFEDSSIKVGDFVIYGRYNSTDVTIQEQTYLLVSDLDIFGKIPDDEALLDSVIASGDMLWSIREYEAEDDGFDDKVEARYDKALFEMKKQFS